MQMAGCPGGLGRGWGGSRSAEREKENKEDAITSGDAVNQRLRKASKVKILLPVTKDSRGTGAFFLFYDGFMIWRTQASDLMLRGTAH